MTGWDDRPVARQNRVTPTGEIVAIPLRGAWMGNRGIIHEGDRIVRNHSSNLWITCALQFRGRHITQWQPRHYTVLFFHDEALSFAAGHRPCAECRRPAYLVYRDAIAAVEAADPLSAKEMNLRLHAERIHPGTSRRRRHDVKWSELPRGAFVLDGGGPALVTDEALVPWTPTGYATPRHRPRSGTAVTLTPPTTLRALRGGYPPQIDGSVTV